MPSSKSGSKLWNPNEMIPLIIRSALTTGVLPDVPGGADACSWIDVDTLSKTIADIAGLGELGTGVSDEGEKRQLIYNIVNPRPFSWKQEFLLALKNAALEFEITSWNDWLERLGESEVDVERNPSRKLLGFWREQKEGGENRKLIFETKGAEEKSAALRMAGNVVAGEYVAGLLEAWKAVW